MLGVGFIENSEEHDYEEQLSNLEDIIFSLKGEFVQVAFLSYSTQSLEFFTFIFIISIFFSQYYVYELKAIWEAKVRHKFRENLRFFPTYDTAIRYKRKCLILSQQKSS